MNKNSNLPKVSIIIPVYNGSDYLRDAIDSALAQTYPNTEVIVINDGSTDAGKTEAIARSYKNKIRYYYKKNGGVSSALNYGIKKMGGEYFSWLSHDDVYTPDKVSEEIKALKGKPETTIIFSNFFLIDKRSNIFSESHIEDRALPKSINKNIFPVIRGMVNGDTVLIHKKVFKECGYFDESLKTSSDYSYWLKIFNNYDHLFIKKPLVKYRIHENQGTKKIPSYNSESDQFWTAALKSITPQQIKSWGVTPLQIYSDLYIQFKNDRLETAMKKAYELCLEASKKDAPLITVLMPCFNSEAYIKNALNSLINSSFGNIEIIVIDDGSTDSSASIIRSFQKKDFRIKVINNSQNLGVSKSLNKGLKIAKGKYFTRLDCDDTITPDKLLKQFLLLEQSNYSFCSTNIALIDKHGNITRPHCYTKYNVPLRFAASLTNPIPNAPIMYRTSIVKEFSLTFPENIKSGEDYAFLLQYLTHGDGTIIDEDLYNYRVRKDSLFHSSTQYTIEKSCELCINYASPIYPNFAKSLFYKKLNSFKPDTSQLTDKEIIALFKSSEQIIKAFADHYNFDDEETDSCHLYVFYNVHNTINAVSHQTETTTSPKNNLLINIRHYIKDNGVKKTIKRALEIISQKGKR